MFSSLITSLEFSGKTLREMRQFISLGNVDPDRLDAGRKTCLQLWQEVEERDVKLVIDNMGRVVRDATSVKVLVMAEGWRLQETGRIYRNGEESKALKRWSVSGTSKRAEELARSAQRELWEECGLLVRLTDFHFGGNSWWIQRQEEKLHESSVYEGIWSQVRNHYALLTLEKLPWRGPRILEDSADLGMKVCVEWFSGAWKLPSIYSQPLVSTDQEPLPINLGP